MGRKVGSSGQWDIMVRERSAQDALPTMPVLQVTDEVPCPFSEVPAKHRKDLFSVLDSGSFVES
jgi:hypothetical protein